MQQAQPLTPMTAVIGKNGVGKSSLFDAFGFLSDCLKLGVEEACDIRSRGGFDRIRSQGSNDPIEFQVYYKQDRNARPITYELAIDADKTGRPYVTLERLRQRRKGQKHGWPFSFLLLNEGKGVVWKGEESGQQVDESKGQLDLFQLMEEFESKTEESRKTEVIELEDKRKLGIATLGALKQHPRISAFRQFIEGWYLSYFTPDAARSLPLAGPQKHLNIHGDNLGNVVQFMEREHPKRFKSILNRIAEKIPGIDKIDTEESPDKRLLLRFNDKGFDDPFYAQQMSDGTLKNFAYLLLLEDPLPPPFICIEEPENGLYHKLLETLAIEFRMHATGKKNAPQLFITTHQPYFVDALAPDETWILEKSSDGFSTIRRASDDATVAAMVDEELPLGSLWYSDYLDAR
jgi:predicted ATPase